MFSCSEFAAMRAAHPLWRAWGAKTSYLGGYPQLSLLEARRKAREYKAQIDDGVDLATVIRKESLAGREIHTIAQLWSDFIARNEAAY